LLRATLGDLPDTHAARARLLFETGLVMAVAGNVGELQQVFFVSEGWLSLGRDDQAPVLPPSADPDRKEVLTVFHIEMKAHKTGMVLLEMKRSSSGTLVAVTDLEVPEQSHTGAGPAQAESPLVEAFLAGYRRGLVGKLN
jgi:hypothetical protein